MVEGVLVVFYFCMKCYFCSVFLVMIDVDLNLLIVLNVLFVEGSVVGVVWWFGLSVLVMSCMLVCLCEVIGDVLLVCVGCDMVFMLCVIVLCEYVLLLICEV